MTCPHCNADLRKVGIWHVRHDVSVSDKYSWREISEDWDIDSTQEDAGDEESTIKCGSCERTIVGELHDQIEKEIYYRP